MLIVGKRLVCLSFRLFDVLRVTTSVYQIPFQPWDEVSNLEYLVLSRSCYDAKE